MSLILSFAIRELLQMKSKFVSSLTYSFPMDRSSLTAGSTYVFSIKLVEIARKEDETTRRWSSLFESLQRWSTALTVSPVSMSLSRRYQNRDF